MHVSINPHSSSESRWRNRWSTLRRDAWQPNWAMSNARAGALCLPVIAGWVLAGVIGGRHSSATLAVAGAFTVGFSAFQKITPHKLLPMLMTLLGIATATFLGSVAGDAGWAALVAVAAICGFAFGALTLLGYGAWWIALQCMIALLVYGAHPYPPRQAAHNSLYVLAGGGSQLLFLATLFPWTKQWFHAQTQLAFDTNDSLAVALARNLHPSTTAGQYAIRVALAMIVATLISHFWLIPNGYWVPMTAIILLKPDRQETILRGINRLCGTLAGAGVTTVILALLRPRHEEIGLLLLVAVWGAYTMQRVNYALFATCVTSYVVLLFAALNLPTLTTAEHRMAATLIGAAIALAVHWMPLRFRQVLQAVAKVEAPLEK